MKLLDAKHALKVVTALVAGESVPQSDIDRARAALERDVQINVKRADRTADWFNNKWRRNAT